MAPSPDESATLVATRPSARAQFGQKALTLVFKAGLSSIPLAALAFDLGQAAVDFGNSRITERFLEELGKRLENVEKLQDQSDECNIREIAAHTAIKRLVTETNPRMANALARAVAEIDNSDLQTVRKAEIARALDVLTEPALHLLQSFHRFNNNWLTIDEVSVSYQSLPVEHKLAHFILNSMDLLQWKSTISTLENAGLIQAAIDGSEDFEIYIADRPLTSLGVKLVQFCFESPEIPEFGKFARQDEQAE